MRIVQLAMLLLALSIPALADKGVIVYKQSGCDYFVVSTSSGYDLFEWFGGYDPDNDDVLVGNFTSYGMHDIHDETRDQKVRVWVEDYDLSKDDALEKLVDHCE